MNAILCRHASIVIILLFNISVAMAEVTASVTLTSNYVSNGISQTDDGPALQAGIDFEYKSGFYVGVWGSNVDPGYELDLNAGYFYKIEENLGFDIGATRFTYTDNNFDEDATEVYIGCLCFVGLFFYAEGRYQGFDYINYDFRTEYEIQNDLTIGLHYGIVEYDGLDGDFYDYYLSLKKSYKKYDIALTHWYSEFTDDAKTFVSLSRKFEF